LYLVHNFYFGWKYEPKLKEVLNQNFHGGKLQWELGMGMWGGEFAPKSCVQVLSVGEGWPAW